MSAVDERPVHSPQARTATVPSPNLVWKTLSASLVVGDRRRSVKMADDRGKYTGWAVRRPAKLPVRPTAALLFDRAGRAHWLGIDLDPAHAGPQLTLRAGLALAHLLFRAGFHPIVDRSPRGGVHVWARLPQPEPVDVVVALVRGIRHWMTANHPGVQLDLAPMANPQQGCLTLPGSPCKGGGHRELVTSLEAAVQATHTRPDPAAVDNLAAALRVVPGHLPHDGVRTSSGGRIQDEDLALIPGGPRPLPGSTLGYFTIGQLSGFNGPSEARYSGLLSAVWRGWSFSDIRRRVEDGSLPALHADIQRPGKGGMRFLSQEWKRAADAVRRAIAVRQGLSASLFHQNEHLHAALHGGGVVRTGEGQVQFTLKLSSERNQPPCHWTSRWLEAAEKWAQEHYTGQRFLTVVAVLHGAAWLALIQDGPGSEWGERVAEMPVRSLHLVTGFIGIATIADVLNELHEAQGSPLLRVWSGRGQLRGSRYYLTKVESGEGRGVRVDPLSPIWGSLGLAAWRVYSALERLGESSMAALVAASGLAKSAVYNAVRVLIEHGLLIRESGRVALGARSIRDVAGDVGAIEEYAAVLEQVRVERAEWKQLHASWAAAAALREFVEPDQMVGPSEARFVDQAVVEARLGPVPWEELVAREPDDDPYAPTVEDQVLDLLENMLGAVRAAPPDVERVPAPFVVAGNRQVGGWDVGVP